MKGWGIRVLEVLLDNWVIARNPFLFTYFDT